MLQVVLFQSYALSSGSFHALKSEANLYFFAGTWSWLQKHPGDRKIAKLTTPLGAWPSCSANAASHACHLPAVMTQLATERPICRMVMSCLSRFLILMQNGLLTTDLSDDVGVVPACMVVPMYCRRAINTFYGTLSQISCSVPGAPSCNTATTHGFRQQDRTPGRGPTAGFQIRPGKMMAFSGKIKDLSLG